MPSSEVNSSNCELCKGSQWIRLLDAKGNQVAKMCACLDTKMRLNYLGPEIFHAPNLVSELYLPVTTEDGIQGDRTEENLFLKGLWYLVCSHLRWVLSAKWNQDNRYTYKIVSDVDLLQVWLGSESYKQRSASTRDDRETFNNLSDLISAPKLLIVRLGVLSSNNRAAANVVQEALRMREISLKPTWIVEDSKYFGPGHKTYSDELGDYIENHFCVVALSGAEDKTASILKEALDPIEDVGIGFGSEKVEFEVATGAAESRFNASSGSTDYKRNRPGRYRPRSGGGYKKKGSDGGGLPDL